MAQLELPVSDDELTAKLLEEAQRRGVRPQELAEELLRQGLGLGSVHHDLDSLAGTWSEADLEEFQATIKAFEEIDPKLWNARRSA